MNPRFLPWMTCAWLLATGCATRYHHHVERDVGESRHAIHKVLKTEGDVRTKEEKRDLGWSVSEAVTDGTTLELTLADAAECRTQQVRTDALVERQTTPSHVPAIVGSTLTAAAIAASGVAYDSYFPPPPRPLLAPVELDPTSDMPSAYTGRVVGGLVATLPLLLAAEFVHQERIGRGRVGVSRRWSETVTVDEGKWRRCDTPSAFPEHEGGEAPTSFSVHLLGTSFTTTVKRQQATLRIPVVDLPVKFWDEAEGRFSVLEASDVRKLKPAQLTERHEDDRARKWVKVKGDRAQVRKRASEHAAAVESERAQRAAEALVRQQIAEGAAAKKSAEAFREVRRQGCTGLYVGKPIRIGGCRAIVRGLGSGKVSATIESVDYCDYGATVEADCACAIRDGEDWHISAARRDNCN